MNRLASLIAPLALVALVVGYSSAGSPPTSDRGTTMTSRGAGAAAPPFRAVVDLATFMEHVLTPAATVVWRTNGFVNDERGDHDLSPKTDADWEAVVSGAATLAEATNALLIPDRVRDDAWTGYVRQLAIIAEQAYLAAERHDLKTISDVSDRLDGVCSACHNHYGMP